MTKTKMTNIVVSTIVTSGTYQISRAIIKNNIKPKNTYQEVSTTVAGIAIAHMVSSMTSILVNRQINEFVKLWNSRTPAQ